MKIFIHTDLEGAVNVYKDEMCKGGDPENGYAYWNLAKDINAAIEGACRAGAKEITVLDSHGDSFGFFPEWLDSRADYDYNGALLSFPFCNAQKFAPAGFDKSKPRSLWGSLDETYSASLYIGAHSMAGTLNGFLDHTMSSERWHNYYINGKKHGELGVWATICAHFGVPVIMVSGDEAACAEARAFLPDVNTVAVKQGIGRNACTMYDPIESREKITKAVQDALLKYQQGIYRLYHVDFPAEIKLELNRSDYCDDVESRCDINRIDARTVCKTAYNGLEILL